MWPEIGLAVKRTCMTHTRAYMDRSVYQTNTDEYNKIPRNGNIVYSPLDASTSFGTWKQTGFSARA